MKETSGVCRPGEMNITVRAVQLCGWKKEDRIADLGCGNGASLEYLEKMYGIRGTGLEADPSFCDGKRILHGDASKLPYKDHAMDGVLMECSLSRMDEPEKVLAECFRVLKPGAFLAVSDMMAEGDEVTETVLKEPESPTSMDGEHAADIRRTGTETDKERRAGRPAETLGRLEAEQRIEDRFRQAGFQIFQVENHNEALKQWFGQLLFSYGKSGLGEVLGIPWDRVKKAKCGYRLWILRKNG